MSSAPATAWRAVARYRPDDEHLPIQAADQSSKAPDTAMLDSRLQAAIQAAIDQLPEM